MGTYGISTEEFLEDGTIISENPDDEGYVNFETFLMSFEGDVCALTVAEAWNKLAKKNKWDDNLQAVNKYSKKVIKD